MPSTQSSGSDRPLRPPIDHLRPELPPSRTAAGSDGVEGGEGVASSGEPLVGARILNDQAPPAVTDIRDAIVIKEGDLFLLTDLLGNVPRGNRNGLGLYYQDTRFLSGHELDIQGLRPTVLHSTGRPHFFESQVLTNPNLVTTDGQLVHEQTIQIRRYRILRELGFMESLTFENFNIFPITLDVALHFEADFADMFEVRGLVEPPSRGERLGVAFQERTLTFTYEGRDRLRRTTRITFNERPRVVRGGTAIYELRLPARGSARLGLTISIQTELAADHGPRAPGVSGRYASPLEGYRAWLDTQARVETSNSLFNDILLQSRYDLRVLVCQHENIPFLAAGIPWFSTLFGRDSLITALQDLWVSPRQAGHVLRLLARFQGQRDDPWRDEEPGKIMHELRRGELANLGLVPFTPYYGTVDATPLFLMLLGEYYRATADLELVRELEPNMAAALAWLERFGDRDGDGFIEYARRSGSGLENQGWKDSWDGIVHADGSLVDPPTALVEVQAYAYAGRRAAARLYRALGEEERARQLEAEAERLRRRFDEAFWMPDEGFYCLALDGSKRQAKVIASNPGHALWCGIVPRERADQVAARLMSEDLFTGWGIRTLASREQRYNPVGYHVGTVWPHDNSLIALGFKRYGQEALLLELATGLYEAARYFPSYRMPELFCGFARSAFGAPVRYPVACSPQAWAAASWSALLQALLGIQLNAPAGELRIVRPRLPAWLHWVEVRRLAVGSGEVDLRYERHGDHTAVDVAAMRGDVRVTLVRHWDD